MVTAKMNRSDMSFLGWFILAVIIGFVLYDMLALWAALRMAALVRQDVEEVLEDEDDDLDEPEYARVLDIMDEDDTTTSAHENR